MTEADLARQIEETAAFFAGMPREFQDQCIADAMLQIATKHNLTVLPPFCAAYAAAVLRRTYELEAAMGNARPC